MRFITSDENIHFCPRPLQNSILENVKAFYAFHFCIMLESN